MTVTMQDIARNAVADAITALCNVSGPGSFLIATAAFASTLAVCPMSADGFAAAAIGTASMNGTPNDPSADNTGTAAVYRARDGADTVIWDGPVATSGGGDMNLPVATRNAGLNAAGALANSGSVQFATDSGFGTVLATVNCNTTAFAAAAGGSIAIDPTGMSTTADAGTVTFYRVRNAANAELWRGTVGLGTGDWPWDNNVVAQDQPIVVSSYSLTMPATIASSDGALVINNTSVVATQDVTVTSGGYTQPAQLV